MRPGEYSQSGFLGPDERLAEVLAADAHALAALDLSAERLAGGLRALLDPVVSVRKSAARIGHHWISLKRYRGFQRCPFEDGCGAGIGPDQRFASLDWQVRNLKTLQALKGPGLIVHLIDAHGFFNGTQVPYRVEPGALARLLELGSLGRAAR